MRRYQIYLNPRTVAILDESEKYVNMSRSKLIREITDRVAQEFLATITIKKTAPKKRWFLDDLAGFIDSGSKRKTNFSERVDDIYFKD